MVDVKVVLFSQGLLAHLQGPAWRTPIACVYAAECLEVRRFVLQALQMRLPPGGPPAEHDTVAFREWREGVQVNDIAVNLGLLLRK